jgi:hypothetical protein
MTPLGGPILGKGPARGLARRAQPRVCVIAFSPIDGRFRGTIRCDGEDGYTKVRSRKARGWVAKGTEQCLRSAKDARTIGTYLFATSGSVLFQALSLDGVETPFFAALERERREIVRILRFAGAEGRADDFTFNAGLTSAHIEPPNHPFAGFADFAAPNEWTGPLSVSFPGAPDVSLTGSRFRVRLRAF